MLERQLASDSAVPASQKDGDEIVCESQDAQVAGLVGPGGVAPACPGSSEFRCAIASSGYGWCTADAP
eukprot:4106594-Karenia_brevis.AAC.1